MSYSLISLKGDYTEKIIGGTEGDTRNVRL